MLAPNKKKSETEMTRHMKPQLVSKQQIWGTTISVHSNSNIRLDL